MCTGARTELQSELRRFGIGAAPERDVPREPECVVVFTRMRTALKALEDARRMSRAIGGRVRLLVPHVVPFPLQLDEPPVSTAFLEDMLRAAVDDDEVETRIEVWVCRDAGELLERILRPASVVILAGPRLWWPSLESRLSKRLEAAGHTVLYSSEGGRTDAGHPPHRDAGRLLFRVPAAGQGVRPTVR
jgi:hypothetical protein